MNHFRLIFPYGGSFSSDTVLTCSNPTGPPVQIHFSVDEWPPEIMETGGVYACTDSFAASLSMIEPAGVIFGPCEVSKSSQFMELHPKLTDPIPKYSQMIFNGTARKDDFGIEGNNKLIVSERVARFLKARGIEDLDIIAIT